MKLRATHACWGCTILIAIHALLLAWAAARNSVTVDEYAHLPAGAAYWKHREFSIYNLSPPLLRYIAAAPVMLAGADAPPALPYRDEPASARHWIYAQQFMEANSPRYHELFVIARLGMIPISCLAAWVVYCWGRSLYGRGAGLIGCGLYCFDPNVLAHASLVTTDAGTAAAVLIAAWLTWRFYRRPSAARLLISSVAVAAALLCKFSTVLLIPALAMIGIWFCLRRRLRWSQLAIGALVIGGVSLLLVHLAYGYHKTCLPLGSFDFASATMRQFAQRLPGWLPVPLPRFLVEGFDAQKWETEAGVPAFALGEYYIGSRWYYYPLTLLCKLPMGTLAVLLLMGLSFLWRRPRLHEWAVLIVAGVFVLGAAVFVEMNIGIRHILPVLPLLYVLAGRLWWRRGFSAAGAVVLMAILLETVTVAPNFLAFFNRAVGGPERGQFILNDSNFDWGQDLIELRQWMQRNQVDRITLAYFGRVDPAVYGIQYTPLSRGIDTDHVAISSYFAAGLPHRLRDGRQMTGWLRLKDTAQLRAVAPVAAAGRTLRIYRRQSLDPAPLMVPATRPADGQ